MKNEDKIFAEKALKQLLIGSQIDGFQFGIVSDPARLTTIAKENLEELNDEDSFQLLLENRREKVRDVQLGDDSPHLYIALESGKILYVNGLDENYECWQLGDRHGYGDGEWLIVAVPGNEIATWSPEEFK